MLILDFWLSFYLSQLLWQDLIFFRFLIDSSLEILVILGTMAVMVHLLFDFLLNLCK